MTKYTGCEYNFNSRCVYTESSVQQENAINNVENYRPCHNDYNEFAKKQWIMLCIEKAELAERLADAEKQLFTLIKTLEKECSDLRGSLSEFTDYSSFYISANKLIDLIYDKGRELERIKNSLKIRGGSMFNLSSSDE